MAGWTGLEPATSCVTGRRSNRLNYHPNKDECKVRSSKFKVNDQGRCYWVL